MKVLVFEFLVGGGVADQHPLNEELQTFFQQGHAMLTSVCEDLLLLEHEVFALADIHSYDSLPKGVVRLSVESEQELDPSLWGAASQVDHILLIAPEADGCLEHFADLLSAWADRFLGPDLQFIRLTGNKWTCHQWLSERNVPCPETRLINEPQTNELEDRSLPIVTKPVCGAGSEGVRLITEQEQFNEIAPPFLLQQYVPGVATSVSVIVDSNGKAHILEPGRQIFDAEPFGIHLRTEYPLANNLKDRALSLANQVVAALPKTRGYFGIDMVLGETQNDDVVIEINPRLTTSYAHLRDWHENLMRLVLS